MRVRKHGFAGKTTPSNASSCKVEETFANGNQNSELRGEGGGKGGRGEGKHDTSNGKLSLTIIRIKVAKPQNVPIYFLNEIARLSGH